MTNSALTPPVAGDTKRAFLVRNGLAKEGARGRFGKDALAALAQFPDFAFTEVVPVAKPKQAKPAGEATAQARTPRVAKPDSEDRAQRAEPVTPLAMPRRQQKVAYVVDPSIGKGGTLLAITTCARADKGGCGKPVNFCTHPAPLAPHYLPKSVALTPMSLTKPVV